MEWSQRLDLAREAKLPQRGSIASSGNDTERCGRTLRGGSFNRRPQCMAQRQFDAPVSCDKQLPSPHSQHPQKQQTAVPDGLSGQSSG
jgi:hypothetical protein